MSQKQKIAFRILFFLYIAAVLYLCFGRFDNAPSIELNLWGIPTDKIVHFLMFFPFPSWPSLPLTSTPRRFPIP